MKNMKSKFAAFVSLVLSLSLLCSSASACTAIYVGSALTEDGTTMFARSEDIANSYNKLYSVIPQGVHTAGEVYTGCYGFTYTFTKDSYGYTAFSDDNLSGVDGVCPDCGGDHPHTPYQAGGTNEMGVTVSATETIGCSEAMEAADPYEELGIEEAEITTVLLSEAATAKEGVELILSIYDNAGCNAGAGIFIADDKETWYIENVTGHQYVALKLSDSMVFAQPNMSIIGKIDLDDAENVIASPKLIEVAQQAGTFVGDAEANVIDFMASYNADQTANSRMISALAFFGHAQEAPAAEAYAISNVGADGQIVPLYTNITLDHAYSAADIQKYYQIDGIGSARNLETHIFQIAKEDSATDTVEWVAMDDAWLNAFVPYYPMLTTDVYAGYKLSTKEAAFVTDIPQDGLFYATTARQKVNGERVTVEGYKILPENWADSCYWTMDALSNLVRSGAYDAAQTDAAHAAMNEAQANINQQFEAVKASVAAAESAEAAAKIATEESMAMAKDVHELGVSLVNGLLGK